MGNRIAALYDIHGNLPALEAVLCELERLDIERIVIGGDVLPGPMPRETLDRLRAITFATRFIHGNGEIAVLRQRDGEIPAVPGQVREIIRWTADQLDDAAIAALRTWPKTLSVEHPYLGSVLFCHATRRDENECFTSDTAEERLLPLFREIDSPIVVCGHTHMQFDRRIGNTRVVNAGSVGMPFGRSGADWLLIDEDGEVALQHTDYDLQAAATRVRLTSYPQADQFADGNVLTPPSAEHMRQVFAQIELK